MNSLVSSPGSNQVQEERYTATIGNDYSLLSIRTQDTDLVPINELTPLLLFNQAPRKGVRIKTKTLTLILLSIIATFIFLEFSNYNFIDGPTYKFAAFKTLTIRTAGYGQIILYVHKYAGYWDQALFTTSFALHNVSSISYKDVRLDMSFDSTSSLDVLLNYNGSPETRADFTMILHAYLPCEIDAFSFRGNQNSAASIVWGTRQNDVRGKNDEGEEGPDVRKSFEFDTRYGFANISSAMNVRDFRFSTKVGHARLFGVNANKVDIEVDSGFIEVNNVRKYAKFEAAVRTGSLNAAGLESFSREQNCSQIACWRYSGEPSWI